MKFKTITYQAVKNLGNYESERLEMTVELEGDEAIAPDKAAKALQRQVNSILKGPPIHPELPEDPDDCPY